MGQVTVNVNGRSYRFDCGDGEEPRLQELAAYVKNRIDKLTQQFGRVGEERLLLMAALLITDELMDARAAAAPEQKPQAAEKEKGAANGHPAAKTPAAQAAERREQAAIRAEHNRRIASGEA